jgi:hypothetical protein
MVDVEGRESGLNAVHWSQHSFLDGLSDKSLQGHLDTRLEGTGVVTLDSFVALAVARICSSFFNCRSFCWCEKEEGSAYVQYILSILSRMLSRPSGSLESMGLWSKMNGVDIRVGNDNSFQECPGQI